jgi:hypothetical protein
MTKPGQSPGHADDHSDNGRRQRIAGSNSLPSTSPEVLRELAAVIEKRDPARRARQSLTPESLEELADMLLAGKRPSLGWWVRNLPKVQS